MLSRLLQSLYRRLGARYWLVLVAAQAGASMVSACVSVVLLLVFFDPEASDFVVLVPLVAVLTCVAVMYAALRRRSEVAQITAWGNAESPTPAEAVVAWQAAATFIQRQYQRDAPVVNLIAVVPTVVTSALLLELSVGEALGLVVAAFVPVVYITALSYSVGEWTARPLARDLARALPEDFDVTVGGLRLSKRLKIAIPAYAAYVGFFVAVIVGPHDGLHDLLRAEAVALAVAVPLSAELAILLSQSITRPVLDVEDAMRRVRGGDFDAWVPVTSTDELGELAQGFNQMAAGLADRERMRETFGTYMDRQVATLLLSGQFPTAGVEIDVSILFLDLRGFTTYAESVTATEVIATLNELFAVIVPIVEGEGGHIDKFLGDGLLAVFGAPEPFVDHADRAVRAGLGAIAAVDSAGLGLRLAGGVNSGRVVVGSVGGAGRLNFSVIGDAVNVAARVEAATRSTGDDLLLTDATRALLVHIHDLEPRGALELKGKALPVRVFAAGANTVVRRR